MLILTGGAGFIGSALLAELNKVGRKDIIVVDDLGSDEKWKNLSGKIFSDYVHKNNFLDVLERNVFSSRIDAIIHLGACSSTTATDASYMMENNYQYSKRLTEWALKRPNTRFIYASSAATYGDGSMGFSDDLHGLERLAPLNVYGFSKHSFDLWAKHADALRRICGLKFFNVFGPNEYHKGDMQSVVVKAFRQINKTGKLELFKSHREDYADGEQKRDFIYVKDCCRAICWLLENRNVCGLYNLGSGQARSWNELARAVFDAMGRAHAIEYVEMPEHLREKYQYFTQAEMHNLHAAGYHESTCTLEEAVHDYVGTYLQQQFARM